MSEAPVQAYLPSAQVTFDLAQGKASAIPGAVRTTALRAGLIGAGLLVARRSTTHLLRDSIAGALSVEAFLVAYQWARIRGFWKD